MTPALDHRSAARILDLADPADASSGPRKAQAMAATVLLFAISAIAAHATVAGGSPTAALGADSFSARVGRAHAAATQESSHMHRLMAVAASGAVAMGSSAFAQDAVQWRVEDGGNGHWYAVHIDSAGITATQARAIAENLGAELLEGCGTEFDWFYENAGVQNLAAWRNVNNPSTPQHHGPWIGLQRTDVGFTWPGGATCTFDRWDGGEPTIVPQETVVMFFRYGTPPNNRCHDVPPISISNSAALEWSADCNSDGIVDYGQIRAGELDDANANNIPDCCEAGTACGCAADISGNSVVDAVDLAAVLSSWGNAPTGKTNADINRDGEIDAIDLAEVLSSWGACP
jgi:hypothetical protein